MHCSNSFLSTFNKCKDNEIKSSTQTWGFFLAKSPTHCFSIWFLIMYTDNLRESICSGWGFWKVFFFFFSFRNHMEMWQKGDSFERSWNVRTSNGSWRMCTQSFTYLRTDQASMEWYVAAEKGSIHSSLSSPTNSVWRCFYAEKCLGFW